MSEKSVPFVVTDRRKFTLDGEPRPDADPSPVRERPREEAAARAAEEARPAARSDARPAAVAAAAPREEDLPPPPTPDQMSQSKLAYEQTANRLDTAVRAANPGLDHAPAMSFESLVQSIYMSAVMQMGGGTPEGQKPQVDLMGARQSIDMLGIVSAKTQNNLSSDETQLLDSALFELRLAFLEVTQALARSAQAQAQQGSGGSPRPVPPGRPSIVR